MYGLYFPHCKADHHLPFSAKIYLVSAVISVFTMQQRFRAKVVEKDEETGEVVVHFDGWSSRYDELIHIGEGRLRPLSQEQLQKASRTCKHKVGRV